jgi:hypothetical protein
MAPKTSIYERRRTGSANASVSLDMAASVDKVGPNIPGLQILLPNPFLSNCPPAQ